MANEAGPDLVGVEETRGPKVAVLVPTYGTVETGFAFDLARLHAMMGGLVHTAKLRAWFNKWCGRLSDHAKAEFEAMGVLEDVKLTFQSNTYLHSARQQLAESFLETDADYALWLDSDMRFPRHALLHLLNRGVDIVGINYSMRGFADDGRLEFVAVKQLSSEHGESKRCVTMPESTGIEEVAALGFGCVLIHRRVFEALAEAWPVKERAPWFWYEWHSDLGEKGQMVGEDVYFFKLVRDLGFKVWCDHDLTKECAHIGTMEYKPEYAQMFVPERDRIARGVKPDPANVIRDMVGEPLIKVVS